MRITHPISIYVLLCDFEALCAENDIRIINRLAVNGNQQGSLLSKHVPNLFGEVAIYRVSAL